MWNWIRGWRRMPALVEDLTKRLETVEAALARSRTDLSAASVALGQALAEKEGQSARIAMASRLNLLLLELVLDRGDPGVEALTLAIRSKLLDTLPSGDPSRAYLEALVGVLMHPSPTDRRPAQAALRVIEGGAP